MTLIEMTVALALLSLLSVGILTSFRIGERSWRQLSKTVDDDRDVLNAHRFLRQVFESAYPFQPSRDARTAAFGLEGTSTGLNLTAPMPQGGGDSGYARYLFAVEESERGSKSLVVRWALDRNGLQPEAVRAPVEDLHREVLIERVQSVEWGYLEAADPAIGPGDANWRSLWTDHRKLPALVRLRVRFAPDDTRQWPELVVAPRITDDALCQFDAVSQTCREAGR